MPFFFAFPSSFDLYPFSFSPPVSTSTIRLSDLTHDIVELSLYVLDQMLEVSGWLNMLYCLSVIFVALAVAVLVLSKIRCKSSCCENECPK